jgi:hypothetical protein
LRLKAVSSSGEVTYAPFGTLAAHKLLTLARSKNFKSLRLQARVPCQGTLSWRRPGATQWSQTDFTGPSSTDATYRVAMPQALAEVLLRHEFELSISVQPYGSLYASPIRPKKQLAATKIPRDLAAFIATQGRTNGEQRGSPRLSETLTSVLIHQRYARRLAER